ncbi:MAG: cytochrome c [Verrucomicrobiota bacterium]
MLRAFFLLFTVAALGVISLVGFRGTTFVNPPVQLVPDMKHQPKFVTQHSTGFFADGRADHPPIVGTVPVGYTLPGRYYQTGVNNISANSGFTRTSSYGDTGLFGDVYGDGIPLPVNRALLERGKDRFEIHCAVCHDKAGSGNGVIKGLGLATIASLQDDRIRQQPDGQIYNTITHGKNTMGAYGPNIAVEDRWAIVAYIRALQISQNAKVADLPASLREQLNTK